MYLTCDDNSCDGVSSFVFNINSEAVTSRHSAKNVLLKILQSLQKNHPPWSHFLKLSCWPPVFNFNKRGPRKGGGFCEFCEIFNKTHASRCFCKFLEQKNKNGEFFLETTMPLINLYFLLANT